MSKLPYVCSPAAPRCTCVAGFPSANPPCSWSPGRLRRMACVRCRCASTWLAPGCCGVGRSIAIGRALHRLTGLREREGERGSEREIERGIERKRERLGERGRVGGRGVESERPHCTAYWYMQGAQAAHTQSRHRLTRTHLQWGRSADQRTPVGALGTPRTSA